MQPSRQFQLLSVFSLVMITVTSVDSIRNLPATALFGSTLIFFFIVAALVFLIPCALVSAELASAWPKQGGIYVWVREALGMRWGFTAIWLQWIENVVWYPTILSFVAGTLAYLISPDLINHKPFLISIVLLSFWGATFINLMGMRSSAFFSSVCGIAGLLIPMALIIALGTVWVLTGKKSEISFALPALLPTLHDPQMWVSLTGIVLSFCGIEIATVHAREVRNPQRAFPKALLISVMILLSTLMFGALAIAIVVPAREISLVAGNMQAFSSFLSAYHMSWLLPLIAVAMVIGGLGSVSNWIIAPTKGLMIAGRDGNLPPLLQQENKAGAPYAMLWGQAIIVSLLTLCFLVFPSVNASYWLLTALASQLYMLMYILMFIAALVLRYREPEVERPYRIPGGKIGIWLVCGLGVLSSSVVVIIGFVPPTIIPVGNLFTYEGLLTGGLIVMCLPPFIAYHYRRSDWAGRHETSKFENEPALN